MGFLDILGDNPYNLSMQTDDKVVLRFLNGGLMKGHLKEFSQDAQEIVFEALVKDGVKKIPANDLKAIFFVKTFEGDREYREKKKYGIRKKEGRKIFVKFKDGESMVGYLQGEMPWDKGFFLSKPDNKRTGFFLVPVDEDSNNLKIFVVRSSVKDITALP